MLADKEYKSTANDELFAACGSRPRTMHKGSRNRPVNAVHSAENREISRKRWAVERTFRCLKRCFGSGSMQLKRLQKMHAEHVMEAIAHNLERFPRIAASISQNQGIKGGYCLPEELFQAAKTAESRLKSSQKSMCPLKYSSSKFEHFIQYPHNITNITP